MRFTPAQIVVSSMRLDAYSLHIGRNIDRHTCTVFTQSSIKSCTNLFHIFTKDIGRQVVNCTTCCVDKILLMNIMFIFLHLLPTTSCSPADFVQPGAMKILIQIVCLQLITILCFNQFDCLPSCRIRSEVILAVQIVEPSNFIQKSQLDFFLSCQESFE